MKIYFYRREKFLFAINLFAGARVEANQSISTTVLALITFSLETSKAPSRVFKVNRFIFRFHCAVAQFSKPIECTSTQRQRTVKLFFNILCHFTSLAGWDVAGWSRSVFMRFRGTFNGFQLAHFFHADRDFFACYTCDKFTVDVKKSLNK